MPKSLRIELLEGKKKEMMKNSALKTFEVTDSNGIIRIVPKWLKDILDRHLRYAFCSTENGRVELFFPYPFDERVFDGVVEMAPPGRVVGRVVGHHESDRAENVIVVVMSF